MAPSSGWCILGLWRDGRVCYNGLRAIERPGRGDGAYTHLQEQPVDGFIPQLTPVHIRSSCDETGP
jgi:hypothetical protein